MYALRVFRYEYVRVCLRMLIPRKSAVRPSNQYVFISPHPSYPCAHSGALIHRRNRWRENHQVVCYPRVSNIAPLPPCYEVRTHLRPILHMVLRHLLIASQLQLLDAPPPSPVPGSSSFSSKTYFARSVQLLDAPHGGNHADVRHGAPAVIPIVSSGRRIVPVETGFNGHARRNTEGGRKQDDVEEVSSSAAGEGGAEPDAVDASDQKRDWHGTSSDAFEIAIAVLKVGGNRGYLCNRQKKRSAPNLQVGPGRYCWLFA